MEKMKLHMRDECDGSETVEIDDRDEAESVTEDWCRDGSWGDQGARITCWYGIDDEDEECIDVEIEPDHDELIKAAGGDVDCDHDWTAEGEGGCRENPGVWSTGGTSMVFLTHCRKCGLRRTESHTGSQRNPGECDTFAYEQPDTWCTECEREECECESA